MVAVPFPPWIPDAYDLNSPGAVAGEAKGVLPGVNAYRPWDQAVVYSEALAAVCRGAVLTYSTSSAPKIFAGTAAKLYKFVDPETAWTDVTRLSGGDYGVSSDERWSFTPFGDTLIAANISDATQSIGITSGSNFAALSGSPPNSRIAQTVGEFVMLGGISGTENSVRWCGRRDATYWTSGKRDAGAQVFREGGAVYGVTPLEGGLIFQERAIRRYWPVASRAVFNFKMVEKNRGLKAPDSLVTLGGVSFYLSEDGFYATDGSGQSTPIGSEQVDRWFRANIEYDRVYYISATADPTGRRIYWLFPSVGNTGESMDMCLCYDIALKRWTYADDFADSLLFAPQTSGYTMETIGALITSLGYTDLDDFPISLDSKTLSGGSPFTASFSGSTFKMMTHSGSPRAATLETADFQPIPQARAYVRGCDLLTDATGATATLGRKERPQGAVSFGSAQSQTSTTGKVPIRGSTRFARVRMSIPAGEVWTQAQGVDVDAIREGSL